MYVVPFEESFLKKNGEKNKIFVSFQRMRVSRGEGTRALACTLAISGEGSPRLHKIFTALSCDDDGLFVNSLLY